MGLNSTPSSERVHIGIFGKRNAGKSSVINAITNQSLAIVSDIKGTTTDPVSKAMELLPLGPVMIIDTPGLDDVGELGKMRIQKSYQVLNKSDIGILVVDGTLGQTYEDKALIKAKNIFEKHLNDDNFGNARFARNLYEKCVINHASNCKDIANDNRLKTLTEEDIIDI